MENYEQALNEYYTTLRVTEGCGARGQVYIDNAFEKVNNAYNNLSESERAQRKLPSKIKCANDGFGGFSSGMAAFASGFRR